MQKPPARVEVFAMSAQMLSQMIDPGGEQRDLDFAGTGVLFVDFVFGDDFWFNDCRHGRWLMFKTVGGLAAS